MKEIQITKFSEYIEFIEGDPGYLFRGVSDKSHKLVPAIARDWDASMADLIMVEKNSIHLLKLRGVTQIDFRPDNDFEWLILGQHYGIPTRILDWTSNPLVALFFACNADFTTDGAVYNFSGAKYLNLEEAKNPFDIDRDYYFTPRHFLPRLAAQSSLFTISKDPLTPFEDKYTGYKVQGQVRDHIVKIIVEAKLKEQMLNRLNNFGVGSASLFPGLDGLCREISLHVMQYKRGVLSLAKYLRENPGRLEEIMQSTEDDQPKTETP